MSDGGCLNGQFCAKQSCDDREGKCTPRPTRCDAPKDPVCGCDGVNYWNDCLRQKFGVAASKDGTCGPSNGGFCGGFGNMACPDPNHTCAMIGEDEWFCRSSDHAGACWGMPDNCPAIDVGAIYVSCWDTGPGGPFPKMCISECEAIKMESPHVADFDCPQ